MSNAAVASSGGTSYVWTGATSQSWNDPTNWLPNGVPSSTDSATLSNGGTIDEGGINHTVAQWIESSGNIQNGTLTITQPQSTLLGALAAPRFFVVDAPAHAPRAFNVSAALGTPQFLDISLAPSGFGASSWTGGAISANLTISAHTELDISGAGNHTLGDGTTTNNSGTVVWSGSGPIYVYNGCTWNNLSGSAFYLAADGQPFSRSYTPPTFNNQAGATFSKTAGSGTTSLSDWNFTNSGTFNAGSGTLQYDTSVSLLDGAVLGGAGIHNLASSTVSQAGTTTFSGATFSLAGGTLSGASGSLFKTTNSGAFKWTSGALAGTVGFDKNSAITVAGTPQSHGR